MGLTRVSGALARAAAALADAGLPSARTDAELLAAHVLAVPRGHLALVAGFDPDQLAEFERLVARRADRVPLQHLTGIAGFGRLELAVGPGGFVPRPETELLAQWAVSVLRAPPQQPSPPAPIVVDLCSGTGALALAIAHEHPYARVFAVERSPAALVWLRRNAADRAAAGDRPIEVVAADATDPTTLATLDGTVDLVVCNPPYVPSGLSQQLPPEVTGHDPAEAVFGGPDGLAVIRPVLRRAADLLRPGGWLGIEHDETHAEQVPALMRPGFVRVADHPDLAGRPRFTTGQRRPGRQPGGRDGGTDPAVAD